MYSLKDDLVMDPFLGTGTTMLAAITYQRDSIGYEIDSGFYDLVNKNVLETPLEFHKEIIFNRLKSHRIFIDNRKELKGKNAFKYMNNNIDLSVMTRQETDIRLSIVKEILQVNNGFHVGYEPLEI